MVLFLAKSAACIGLVAAAASGVGLLDLGGALGRGARHAAESAGQACVQSAACVRAGAEAAALAAARGGSHPARGPRSGSGT